MSIWKFKVYRTEYIPVLGPSDFVLEEESLGVVGVLPWHAGSAIVSEVFGDIVDSCRTDDGLRVMQIAQVGP